MIRNCNIYKKLLLAILIALVFMKLGCDTQKVESDEKLIVEKNEFRIPIYSLGEITNHEFIDTPPVKRATYEVRLYYPAEELIEFYETEMVKLGYNPFVEEYYEYADRKWQYYVDGTVKGNPEVASFSASWSDAEKKHRVILLLKYYWHDKADPIKLWQNKDNLIVAIQIMPFVIKPPPK
jgi:hypothetical protein